MTSRDTRRGPHGSDVIDERLSAEQDMSYPCLVRGRAVFVAIALGVTTGGVVACDSSTSPTSEATRGERRNAPRVWVQPPAAAQPEVGMTAIVYGVLRYDASNDCFQLERAGERVAVVWPTGTASAGRGVGVALRNGRVVRVGTPVHGGGGYLTPAVVGPIGVVLREIPEPCLGQRQNVATFNAGSTVTIGKFP